MSAETFAVLPRMGKPGANALAQNLTLELGERSQQCGHGAAGGRGQIKSFGERHEADAEMLQFLQSREQVGY